MRLTFAYASIKSGSDIPDLVIENAHLILVEDSQTLAKVSIDFRFL